MLHLMMKVINFYVDDDKYDDEDNEVIFNYNFINK